MKLFKRKMGKKQKAALNALADGIECGAQLHPQSLGNLAVEDFSSGEQVLKTCALGAALEYVWVKQGKTLNADTLREFRSTSYDAILELYGVPNEQIGFNRIVEIDGCAFKDEADISTIIWNLNDQVLKSREEIAAILRTLE